MKTTFTRKELATIFYALEEYQKNLEESVKEQLEHKGEERYGDDNMLFLTQTLTDVLTIKDSLDGVFETVAPPCTRELECPVVTIKIPLYTCVEDNDEVYPLRGDDLEGAIIDIKSKDDVGGWSIGSIDVGTESVFIP